MRPVHIAERPVHIVARSASGGSIAGRAVSANYNRADRDIRPYNWPIIVENARRIFREVKKFKKNY